MPRPAFVLALALAVVPSAARAQRVNPCSYDECALRLEGRNVLAGRTGLRVASFGILTGPDLTQIVGGNDSATFYAAQFERRHNRGSVLGLVGVLVSLAGVVLMYADGDISDGPNAGSFAAILVGGSIGIAGTIQVNNARKDFARSIWWYNRELGR